MALQNMHNIQSFKHELMSTLILLVILFHTCSLELELSVPYTLLVYLTQVIVAVALLKSSYFPLPRNLCRVLMHNLVVLYYYYCTRKITRHLVIHKKITHIYRVEKRISLDLLISLLKTGAVELCSLLHREGCYGQEIVNKIN